MKGTYTSKINAKNMKPFVAKGSAISILRCPTG
jgi:hypothetical protein